MNESSNSTKYLDFFSFKSNDDKFPSILHKTAKMRIYIIVMRSTCKQRCLSKNPMKIQAQREMKLTLKFSC